MSQTDQGYSVIEGVFAGTDMNRLLEGLSSAAPVRTRAGARHLLGIPIVQDLATDPRMLKIAREFVGSGAVPFRATLFDKSRTANWLPSPHHLYWPDLDVDLAVESLIHPERYPLVSQAPRNSRLQPAKARVQKAAKRLRTRLRG